MVVFNRANHYLGAFWGAFFLLFYLGCNPIDDKSETRGPDIDVFSLNPPAKYDSLMKCLKPEGNSKCVSFLWFTDIHENVENLERILDWHRNYKAYFDDILATGDQQNLSYTNDFSWWRKKGADGVLQIVGNHDAWIYTAEYESGKYVGEPVREYGAHYIMSQKDVYRLMFSQYVTKWNVIQPPDADSLGLCYYYKDYQNLRLIMLDCMHFGVSDDLAERKKSRQNKWLIEALNDAKTKHLSVMIGSHYPVANSIPTVCSYTYSNSTGRYSERLNSEAYKNVSRFLDEGGDFVCWITGHGHYDEIGVLEPDPRQLMIRCATANNERWNQNHNDFLRHNGTKAQDSFNCISIDPSQKLIYMVKVGADINKDGSRKRIVKYRYRDYIDDSNQTHTQGLISSE